MTDLAQLIAKLEAASEGSRELDFWMTVLVSDPKPNEDFAAIAADLEILGYGDMHVDAPFTTSLDAIVALIERKLPGQISPLFHEAWAFVSRTHDLACRFWRVEVDGSYQRAVALALCIAFLRALQAQQETSEDE